MSIGRQQRRRRVQVVGKYHSSRRLTVGVKARGAERPVACNALLCISISAHEMRVERVVVRQGPAPTSCHHCRPTPQR